MRGNTKKYLNIWVCMLESGVLGWVHSYHMEMLKLME